MTTLYYTAASVDGFIATPDDSLEWLFRLGDVNDTGFPDFFKHVGALAMGSTTYEWVLRHVIESSEAEPGKWPYTQPAWVFSSRTRRAIDGADIRFVNGSVLPVHKEMTAAANGKHVWLVGGGELVGQFYDAGLLDEIIVQVGSVMLGAGKPLLPRKIIDPPLRLLSAQAMGPGFAELRYAVQKQTSIEASAET